MLDVCLLGTGGMMPLPNRWLSSMLIRFNGKMILVDCGEGTQITLKMLGWGFKNINTICFTHYHADHISGLPGMLLTLGNAERTEPLTLVGPVGLEKVVNALRTIANELPYEIYYKEIDNENVHELILDGYTLKTCGAKHGVSCLAYSIETERTGKFDLDKALELKLPRNFWGLLQHGQEVVYDDKVYLPSMVMGERRKGFKITYCTDSRPTNDITLFAKNADLFICEGMYAEKDKEDKAKERKHMMFYEAANMAKEASVKELWLTHYSPSLTNPKEYLHVAKEIFENTKAGYDRIVKSFVYDDKD
ncbi:MAG: ribonuclease Z [Clostridiales bacterium GWE2_32_10]|nr:MAG: ribonuclease Z [Clostridiales bacterium GWE2_32_10]HBY20619.1 ribonuclease Z [Clostridiales bacterium]